MNNPEILSIKSDKNELIKVQKFLSDIFEKKNLPGQCYNKVLLCISEAVVNSIEHGNKNDLHKEVDIRINCLKGNICIEIHDEGEGFDYNKLEDPTTKNNIKKESGRGIFIIKSLCNELEFKDQGKIVEIKIDLA